MRTDPVELGDEKPEPAAARRRLLAEFIRAHRGRLTPEAVGLPAGTRRRTPGLRREELAQLCGVSATWYTWIEQGREVSVSPSTLARLAKALQLNRAERAYLFDLAGKRDTAGPPAEPGDLPPAMAMAVQSIACPAYLLDRSWNARAWNAPAARLFVGWLDRPEEPLEPDRNLLRYIFLDPGARGLIWDWEERARRVLAEFRADYSVQLQNPQTQALIEELRRQSDLFAAGWEVHSVIGREGGERRFNHPADGLVSYEQISFNPATRPEFKLVMLVKRAG
ncbi:MAG: hypothetical protein QOK29_4004 [Rhodospirillaceae bacterium]|jgi:transcriptional regulator with XRE-family HTH domain|nr:hypothetical protein [Rhodospirillaceae bacterium]